MQRENLEGLVLSRYSQIKQGCKKFKSLGEEYQVVKRGRKYHGSAEEYNVDKTEKGNIIYLSTSLK